LFRSCPSELIIIKRLGCNRASLNETGLVLQKCFSSLITFEPRASAENFQIFRGGGGGQGKKRPKNKKIFLHFLKTPPLRLSCFKYFTVIELYVRTVNSRASCAGGLEFKLQSVLSWRSDAEMTLLTHRTPRHNAGSITKCLRLTE